MAKERNVELEIRAKNLTTEAFKKVSEALKALEDQSESISGKGTTSWGKWFATISGGVAVGNLLSSAFKTGLGILSEIPGQLLEIAARGNDVDDVRQSFIGFAGSADDANEILKQLRTSFGGTVSDFELMKSSNELLRRGVQLTAQEFGVLTQGARILANQVGGDGKANFDSFMAAIGRGNEKELKQLGVNMVNVEREIQRTASSLGKEVSALTQSQKQQALKNASLAEASRLLRENGEVQNGWNDNIKAAGVLVENWRDRLGEAIATSPQLNVALGMVTDAMREAFGSDQQEQVKNIARLIGLVAIASVNAAKWVVTGAQMMASAYYSARAAFDSVVKSFNDREIRETQKLVDSYQHMVDRGVTSAKLRLQELQMELAGLKGYSEGLAGDAADATATNKRLGEMAANAQKFLADMEIAMRNAGDSAGAADKPMRRLANTQGDLGDAAVEAGKRALEVSKKIREMEAAADLAAKNHALEAWARQNGDALNKLAVDAASVGKNLKGNLFDAMLLNMKASGAEHFKREFDRILKEQQESLFQSIETSNAAFDAGLGIRLDALNTYANDVAKRTQSDLDYQLTVIQWEEDAKIAELERLKQATTENLDAVRQMTAEKMAAARVAHNAEVQKMKAEADSWGNRFKTILGSIPGLLKNAFTGGGGLKGFGQALTAQIGESLLGKGAEQLLNKGIQGLFNKGLAGVGTVSKLAGLAGPIAGMIGSLAGPLISKGLSKLGSLLGFGNKEKKENQDATNQVKALGAELVKTYGSMENLRALGKLTGIDIAAGFGHQGKQGLAQFKGDLESFQKKVSEVSGRINKDLGGILEEAQGIGFRMPEALQGSLDALRQMGIVSEENAALLASLGTNTQIDFKKMEEAATALGINFDALGGGFNTAKFNASASQILEWIDILERGGADMGAVLAGAADEVSELVQRSMRLGISMPENLRSIAVELIKNSLLLDANGDKITDINKLSFGDPIKVGLERIGDLLEKLLKGLGIELPRAIGNIPRSVDLDVNVNYHEHGKPDGSGFDNGDGPTFDVPGAAAGGLFSKPTFRVVAEQRPEIVGAPNVIVDALAAAIQRVGIPGGSSSVAMDPATMAAALQQAIEQSGLATKAPTYLQIPADAFQRALRDGAPIVVQAVNDNHLGARTTLQRRGRTLGAM